VLAYLKSHLVPLALSLAAIFAPVRTVLLAAGALIALDFVTGVYVAIRRKEPVTSAKMKATIAKMLAYETLVCVSYLMQHYLMGDLIPVVNLAGTYIAATEGKSVLENVEGATGVSVVKALTSALTANKTPKE
jgi:hypothetical protein